MEAKAALKGYRKVSTEKQLKGLKEGDYVKYAVNGELRHGGFIKLNKFPRYLVLRSGFRKYCSWCVSLTDPTLQVWKLVKKTTD